MCNLIDASDILYLIIDHTPTANPLAKASNLKSYNKVWFFQDITAPPCKFNYLSQPELVVDIPIDNCFPIMAELL